MQSRITQDLNQLSNQVIGLSIDVHKELGPGLLESVYEDCLCYELKSSKIRFERQKYFPIIYKNTQIANGFRLDIVIENSLLLELKTVEKILPIHEAQILTYMKLSEITLGLIINFNVPILKNGIKRIVNNFY